MKTFIIAFIASFALCLVVVFLFASLFSFNIWAAIAIAALFLAVLITAYANQDSRIAELEQKVQALSDNQQSTEI